MPKRMFSAIACFTAVAFFAVLCGTLYAENVEDPSGSGNWVVTEDPPNPDPAGGIDAAGGDSVIVNDGGIIDSPDDGVECTTDEYDITNNGTIDANHDGIHVRDNNTVTNNGTINAGDDGIFARYSSTITNNGIINAADHGINVWSGNEITNDGTINAGDDGINGGFWNIITNNGTLNAAGDGIEAGGNFNTITNSGTINSGDHGILTADDGTITNNGTIDADRNGIQAFNNNTVTNSGTVNANERGINVIDNNAVTNSGTIEAGIIGIFVRANSTVTNEGTINARDGIFTFDNNTVANNGAINAWNDGISVLDGNTVTNNGTIDAGNHGIEARDNNTITNSGTVIGRSGTAVLLNRAGNTVRLMPGSTTTGDIEVGAAGGPNTVELHGFGIFGDQFVDNPGGSMSVRKQGMGTWALTNFDATDGTVLGSLEINQGTLRVDGLLMTERYTQDPGAVLSIGVEGTTSSGLVWVDWQPAFNDGDLQPVPIGYVPDGAAYNVFYTARPGGFDNYFGRVVDTAVLDFTITYPGNDTARVTVNRLTYPEVLEECSASTENQVRIGENLQEMVGTVGGDMADVLLELDSLSDCAEFQDALDQMSPEVYGGLRDVSLTLADRWGQAVQKRLKGLRTGAYAQGASGNLYASSGQIVSDAGRAGPSGAWRRTGIWAGIFRLSADQDAGQEHFGYDYDAMGISLGGDYSLSRDLVLGVNLGFADTDVEYDTVTSETEAETFQFGLYGAYDFAPFTMEAHLSWARNSYESYRYIRFGGIDRRASSDHHADEITAYAGLDYALALGGFDLVPKASLQYSHYDAESFDETGAGALNLDVSSFDADSFLSRIGATVSRDFEVGGAVLSPEVSAFWGHEFGDTDREIKARFTGGNAGTFTVEGVEPDRDSALLGAGLNIAFEERGFFYLRYDGELRDDFDAHRISCGIKCVF